MDYNNLWDVWLEAMRKAPPKDFSEVKNREGAPKNYFLTPEDMTALLNAYSPYDLYNKPNTTPQALGYPTSAFNISNYPGDVGINNAIVQASQDPKSLLTDIYSIKPEDYNNVPEMYYPFGTQGIYEHELGHYFDPRLNKYINRGYLAKQGSYQGTPITARESPAQRSEGRYWVEDLGLREQ